MEDLDDSYTRDTIHAPSYLSELVKFIIVYFR